MTGPGGRPLLQDAARVESDLLRHWGFAVDELAHIAEHSIPADLAELLHREHTCELLTSSSDRN